MKKNLSFMAFAVMAVFSLALVSCGDDDDDNINDNNNPAEGEAPTGNSINGHEYIDLGLPSGIKWANCNVGAAAPEDDGDYYAWGEITTKSEYTEENCATWKKNIGDISANPQYDAARANWGGSWRLPTVEELEELSENCSWELKKQNGNWVYIGRGPNGNTIILPADNSISPESNQYHANYWGSTPHESDTRWASCLELWYGRALGVSRSVGTGYDRWIDIFVRPVSD